MANTIKKNLKRLGKEIKELKSSISELSDNNVDPKLQKARKGRIARLEEELDEKIRILDEVYTSLLSFAKSKMELERGQLIKKKEGENYLFKLNRRSLSKNIGDYTVKHPILGKISIEELAELELVDRDQGIIKEGAQDVQNSMASDKIKEKGQDRRVVGNIRRSIRIAEENLEPEEDEEDR